MRQMTVAIQPPVIAAFTQPYEVTPVDTEMLSGKLSGADVETPANSRGFWALRNLIPKNKKPLLFRIIKML